MPGRQSRTDTRGRLGDDPFTHQVTKHGSVRVLRGGREVCVVGGSRAERLLLAMQTATDEHDLQLLLAKASGHYRHGNER